MWSKAGKTKNDEAWREVGEKKKKMKKSQKALPKIEEREFYSPLLENIFIFSPF